MTKEKAISLIKKVLSKAGNNPSEQEAETAILKAQELLVKYGLSMEDVESVSEQNAKEVIQEDITKSGKTSWWAKSLGSIVAENFKCSSFTKTGRGKSNVLFIGLKEDVAIAKEIYHFMRESIEYLSKCYAINYCNEINNTVMRDRPEHLRKFVNLKDVVGEKNDYIRGFLSGLSAKFKEQIEKNNWGLILVKDKAVTDYIGNLLVRTSKVKSGRSSGNKEHFEKGYADGKSMEHNKKLLYNRM